ncbi:MAG: hypothetical protein ACRECD_01120 [Burkholderiaceae bacterium]
MALERNQIKPPVLPKEAVQVDALGGELIVRGLLLSQRLEMSALNAGLSAPLAGETELQARARAGGRLVANTLARCVVLADGEPMWSADQWDQFGATHPEPVLHLFKVARRLGGHDEEAIEKN